MPGIVDGIEINGNSSTPKENVTPKRSPNGTLIPEGVEESSILNPGIDGAINTPIEELYENVYEMESSDHSQSRNTFGSDGEESRIDSELQHLAGGEMKEVEIMEEEIAGRPEDDSSSASLKKGISSMGKKSGKKSGKIDKPKSANTKSDSFVPSNKASRAQLDSELSSKSSIKGKSSLEKSLIDKQLSKQNVGVTSKKKFGTPPLGGLRSKKGTAISSESKLANADLGPFLLKQARDLISSGEDPKKALELALRAAKSFEIYTSMKPSLEYVMCLHVTAAIYCSLGQYNEAIPLLEHSIEIPALEEGQEHGLAKFAGYMQLGDTYAMLGRLGNAIMSYAAGLEVQRQILGETDPRVGETCRYLAEAHVQALQFDEAKKLCQKALDIHKENGSPASLEEAADRRLMGLICETKGDHEAALEHLVLASMAMVANGQEADVAFVDCSIGDIYLSLSRYDEAVFSYQKALTVFKASRGESHTTVGSVFVRLAELYNRTGKINESKSYCENALRIYEKGVPGVPFEEIASGLTDVSAIYESMNELEQALKLLQKALNIYNNAPGQQSTIAGIEAQMGVMYYMLGNYSESYYSLKNAISKLRASGDKKSAFLGIALNQMGLACVQRYTLNEAIDLFEEARIILEQERGPYHPDTLGVYSNLAGTYDAVGRLDDAIEILDYVVGMREEKLGTANPDVDDEKRRLAELLKEGGRVRSRKARSLEHLLDANNHILINA